VPLHEKSQNIYAGMPGNYVAGANIAACTRVADGMLALGLI
jgi:glutamate dehydrogenase (NADP+)